MATRTVFFPGLVVTLSGLAVASPAQATTCTPTTLGRARSPLLVWLEAPQSLLLVSGRKFRSKDRIGSPSP